MSSSLVIPTKESGRGQKNHCPCWICGDKTAMSINFDDGIYQCHKCDAKGKLPSRMDDIRPVARVATTKITEHNRPSAGAVQYLEGRGISKATALKMGIGSTVKAFGIQDYECLCFNFYEGGTLQNVKYRALTEKRFLMEKGARVLPYNVDGARRGNYVVIVEGELDAASIIEAGEDSVISVPNGSNSKLEWLDEYSGLFDNMERIILATDQDEPGRKLQKELCRRLGVERCLQVDFDDCKDANDYLVKYGPNNLKRCIDNAQPFPIEGVRRAFDFLKAVMDLRQYGLPRGLSTGFQGLDKHMRLMTGYLMVLTGIPGHGKSEFLNQLVINMAILHKMKTLIYSPESKPTEWHISVIVEKITGKRFKTESQDEFYEAFEFINDNVLFHTPSDEATTVADMLATARQAVAAHGITIFIIDHWGKLEHKIPQGQSETNYVSDTLDKLHRFAIANGVLVILVAHTTKMPKTDKDSRLKGQLEVPSLYSISGSAHFNNKADYGVVVYRNFELDKVTIHVKKCRFRNLGDVGNVDYRYNRENGRFNYLEGGMIPHDNNGNYLREGIPLNTPMEEDI